MCINSQAHIYKHLEKNTGNGKDRRDEEKAEKRGRKERTQMCNGQGTHLSGGNFAIFIYF